jgi:hypothetical protein
MLVSHLLDAFFSEKIWRMMRKTKGADWHDRLGFVVRICTEGCIGSVFRNPTSKSRGS